MTLRDTNAACRKSMGLQTGKTKLVVLPSPHKLGHMRAHVRVSDLLEHCDLICDVRPAVRNLQNEALIFLAASPGGSHSASVPAVATVDPVRVVEADVGVTDAGFGIGTGNRK